MWCVLGLDTYGLGAMMAGGGGGGGVVVPWCEEQRRS